MIIPVSKVREPEKLKLPEKDYLAEIKNKTYSGIIWSCEHISRCGTPLYVGKCREDCFKVYKSQEEIV